MKNLTKTILCGVAALLTGSAALAAVPSSITQFTPNMMNYQGHLYDPAHYANYADGTYNIECRIYAGETDATALWGACYSVYVKDGYFNIMLGDTSAETITGTTYGKGYLWKALWENNDLWMGVTVREDYLNNPIPVGSRSEISPRQRLLAGPYAFRAQAAQYANASIGNFSVGGNLVFGSTPWTVGSMLKSDGSMLTLGVTDGSTPSPSSPAVAVSAKNFSATSNGDIDLKTNDGNINLNVGGAKVISMNGGWLAVTNLATSVTSLAGISMQGLLGVVVGGGLTVKDGGLTGSGNLKWKSNSGNSVKMFKIKTVDVTVPNGQSMFYASINDSGDNNYVWMVTGFKSCSSAVAQTVQCYYHGPSAQWRVEVQATTHVSGNSTFEITLLGINNACVEDKREVVGM